MLTPQAFKTEVVRSTFVLRLSSSLCFCYSSVCARRPQGVPAHLCGTACHLGYLVFPPRTGFLVLQHMKTSFLLDANKVFLCKGRKKIVCCAWNYLLFLSVRISTCADVSQVVRGVLVILSTPWVSCEKPPSSSTSGVLKSCPVPQPRGSPTWWKECECPWSTWEVWFISWKLVCWVCYWMFHIHAVPSSCGSWGWDLICSL